MNNNKNNKIFFIPADIPSVMHKEYSDNYRAITKNSNRLLLLAGDQKIEHLHKDFYGAGIDPCANDPEHLFRLAQETSIGAFATQLGLIARYGTRYPDINYMVKLNSKTDCVATKDRDPLSEALWTVSDVMEFKKQSKLPIRGIGYTVYLGSIYEHIMLTQAAQLVYQAHQHGLVTILWMYPRGHAIHHERDGQLIAGAAGVAACLGTDFAKINVPDPTPTVTSTEFLKIAVEAAGNTKLICSGGKIKDSTLFVKEIYEHLTHAGIAGCATGRNLYQRSFDDGKALAQALSSIIYEFQPLEKALTQVKK